MKIPFVLSAEALAPFSALMRILGADTPFGLNPKETDPATESVRIRFRFTS
jgi:hypothetical protein